MAGLRFFLLRCGDLLADPGRLPRVLSWHFQRSWLMIYSSFFRSVLRDRADCVEEKWGGLQELSAARKVAVFVHFDAEGRLHDFVAEYLRQLVEAGFAVVFVSNSPALPQATIEQLLPACALILRRANLGHDFGAFKDGIAQIPALERIDALLLANDSVYGPFQPLQGIIARMDQGADVWGITDSLERRFHLQSYFLLFNRTALRAPTFSQFWSRLRAVKSKSWTIAKYEVGLTQALAGAGLRCRALFPYRSAAEAVLAAVREGGREPRKADDPAWWRFVRRIRAAVTGGVPLNSMHYFWDYLVERMGCPFMKRELLRDNPMRIPYVGCWREVVAAASAYDTSLIERHLEDSTPGRPVPDPEPRGRPRRTWYA
jgi:lipopolysaccharide biosynthesis protein